MIGYTTLGSNDLDASLAFYDAVLGMLGARRLTTLPDERGFTLYGSGRGQTMLAITRPYDGEAARAGNGVMVAFAAESREQVDQVHARAIALGATDDGAPGARGPETMNFYGGYFRDATGNKLCIYKTG